MLAVVVSLSAVRAEPVAQPALESLAWLAGSWSGTSRGIEMEEHWTAPKGNTMVGIHRDVGNGLTLAFEFLRIEQRDGQLVYLSMPDGRSPATPFALKESAATRVVFENAAHDFPQRIIYWKDGRNLRARIEGSVNGKASSQEWSWSPGSLR